VGKPNWNAAQPCAKAQGYVNDDLRANGLQKGWDFGLKPGMWHAFKKPEGKVVVASSMELKQKI